MPEESKVINTQDTPQIIAANIQLVYANGSGIAMSQSDIQINFHMNGRPLIAVALSMATAKSLQSAIAKALSDYERKTNTKVLDLAELATLLKNP